MSLLSVGAPCSACSTVDFLPFRCPSCTALFCRDHIQLHPCSTASGSAGPSRTPEVSLSRASEPRARCQVRACERVSLEALAGFGWASGSEEKIAREVRCAGCGGSFCSVHRQQADHACAAAPDHIARQTAGEARKVRAAAVIAQHFPDQAGRTIPKPPPPTDPRQTARLKRPTSPERLPPSLLPPAAPSNAPVHLAGPNTAPDPPRKQTKAEKLLDLHIRKVRSLAEPLDGKKREGVKRRVFEWAVDEGGGKIRAWRESGKWDGQPARAWVPDDMPCGRVMDLMVEKKGLKRGDHAGPEQRLGLVALEAMPDAPRAVRAVDLSSRAESLVEGSLIVLVRGEQPSGPS